MTEDIRICPICGSALSQWEKTCPFCDAAKTDPGREEAAQTAEEEAIITREVSNVEKFLNNAASGSTYRNADEALEAYAEQFVRDSLKAENSRKLNVIHKDAGKRQIIASIVFSILMILTVVTSMLYPKLLMLGLAIIIIAAVPFFITLITTTTRKCLRKKIVEMPDAEIDNVLAGECDNMVDRRKVLGLTAGIPVLGLALLIVIFWEPHIIYERNSTGYGVRYLTGSFYEKGTDVYIPDTWKGKPVTEIRGGAFSNRDYIHTVRLPEGITEIRGNTFENCTGMQSIKIPDGVTRIGGYAFRGCSELETIVLPSSVVEIGGYGFSGCHSLRQINLPDGITEIRGNTFEECDNLKEIIIPEGVTRIGGHAFYGCDQLESVSVPSSLKGIGSSAFRLCPRLREISLPLYCNVNVRAFKESPTIVKRF